MVLGINKAPIVEGLESILMRVEAIANPHPVGRGECVAMIFQNPLLDVDGETTNNAQVWIGNSTDAIWLLIPGQESPVFYAEDLKDIYVKLVFPFPNPNGAILTFLVADGGESYTTGLNFFVLSPGGTNATLLVATATGAMDTAAVAAAGAGYLVGDVLTLAGTTGATIEVDTIGGAGEVLTFTILTPGTTSTLGIKATTGGAGAGATINITQVTGEMLTATLVDGGSMFVAGDTYETTFNGVGAQITVLTVEDSVPSVCNLCCLVYRLRKGGHQ